MEKIKDLNYFDSIVEISALKGINIDKLINEIKKYLPEGPVYYPNAVSYTHLVGIISTLVLAVNFGIASNFDYQLAIIYFLGGIFATFMVSNTSQRLSLIHICSF